LLAAGFSWRQPWNQERETERQQRHFPIRVSFLFSDLEELHQKAAMDTEQHRNRMLQHQVILANKMRALEERCAEMEQTETLMKQKNEAEVRQFEKAKEEVIHHFMRPQTCIYVYTVQQLFQDSTLKSHEMPITNDHLCRLRNNWRR
jgi:hypothetical protein